MPNRFQHGSFPQNYFGALGACAVSPASPAKPFGSKTAGDADQRKTPDYLRRDFSLRQRARTASDAAIKHSSGRTMQQRHERQSRTGRAGDRARSVSPQRQVRKWLDDPEVFTTATSTRPARNDRLALRSRGDAAPHHAPTPPSHARAPCIPAT